MRWVVLRDDDTNATTPVACLERLYAPALGAGLPVCLATIPAVSGRAVTPAGEPEAFLWGGAGDPAPLPIGSAPELVRWLLDRPSFRVVQHGMTHDLFELDSADRQGVARRLDDGARMLREAGLEPAAGFVAPYDRLSREAFEEVARRHALISTGWFEARRMPVRWWPGWLVRRFTGAAHWQQDGVTLLSHPGCILSRDRPREGMVDAVRASVRSRRLTVLVTHWWEYFHGGEPDEGLIAALHETLAWLAQDRETRVVGFDEIAAGRVPLG